jgi:hypothetical protein
LRIATMFALLFPLAVRFTENQYSQASFATGRNF